MKTRKPRQAVEVFAHVSLGDEELHVAWHFPDSTPVNESVKLTKAQEWTEVLIAQGRRNRGAPETRNLALVQPAGDSAPEGKLAQVGAGIYAATCARQGMTGMLTA